MQPINPQVMSLASISEPYGYNLIADTENKAS
jgi:hypothetical protein